MQEDVEGFLQQSENCRSHRRLGRRTDMAFAQTAGTGIERAGVRTSFRPRFNASRATGTAATRGAIRGMIFMKITVRKRLLASTLLATAGLIASPAYAQ